MQTKYYYEFVAETPYCGTKDIYYEVTDTPLTKDEIAEMEEDYARQNAESYEYLVFGWGADPVGEGEVTEEEYWDEIEAFHADSSCYCRQITKEEYDEEC